MTIVEILVAIAGAFAAIKKYVRIKATATLNITINADPGNVESQNVDSVARKAIE